MDGSRLPHKYLRYKSKSSHSTDTDTSYEKKYTPVISKHKTELCKTFSMMGHCPYGCRCRFAHGKQELVQLPCQGEKKYLTCNSFWSKGTCRYGTRCQFGHAQFYWQNQVILISNRVEEG